MQVSFEGWSHRDQTHILVGADISELRPSTEKVHLKDNVYISVEEEGLRITSGTEHIELNGSFWIEIRLTNNDIANIASIALGNTPFSEVITAMTKAGQAVSVVNKRNVFQE